VAYTQDPKNANRGTERGQALLAESLDACGVGRGIFTDRHRTIIGGNKSFAAARAKGIATEEVETTGFELVVVQRTDLDLATDPKARRLAYYDNRVQQLDLAWDVPQVQEDVLAGVRVDQVFFPDELQALILAADVVAMDLPAVDPPVLEPAPTTDPSPEPPPPAAATAPSGGRVVLAFTTIEQKLKWGQFLVALKDAYPDAPTVVERLSRHLTAVGIT
jgi:hypothetical protein